MGAKKLIKLTLMKLISRLSRTFSVMIMRVTSERKSSRMIHRYADLPDLSVDKREKMKRMIPVKTKRPQMTLLDLVSYPEATHQHGVNLPAVFRPCLVEQAV